jgi:hypothetical protein
MSKKLFDGEEPDYGQRRFIVGVGLGLVLIGLCIGIIIGIMI